MTRPADELRAPLPGDGMPGRARRSSRGPSPRSERREGACTMSGDRAPFTAGDRELLSAFAAPVGDASGRLHQGSGARGEWLVASVEVTREVLSAGPGSGPDPLRLIAERTCEIGEAELVLVLRPTDPAGDELTVEVGVGAGADRLRGRRLPVQTSLAGRVLTSTEPVRLPHLTDAELTGEVELGPAMAVPLLGSGRVHGALVAARLDGRPGFTDADADGATTFAHHAALALERAEARAQHQLHALLADRQRIADDLHDHVIQRLFATGLKLHGVAGGALTGRAADRLRTAVDDLDEVIDTIRAAIFHLDSPLRTRREDVRDRLLQVLADVRPALGFDPSLRISGLPDDLPPDVVGDLLAVTREALTNTAKHARASTVDVDVRTGDGRLTLRVTDDGSGVGDATRRSGLAGLRRRADGHGGAFHICPAHPRGTRLTWSVPLGRRHGPDHVGTPPVAGTRSGPR
ncbi:GAF domain-containing sensor histidine kinase [Blastococcus sp. MG754426]|nr:GAF domain-containing sensor histidine kinase [Blastococcus sp. MG754426]MCF6510573.1 GAF domain-containing sensor histidine kinase [Blastococcus sp. MG754427]